MRSLPERRSCAAIAEADGETWWGVKRHLLIVMKEASLPTLRRGQGGIRQWAHKCTGTSSCQWLRRWKACMVVIGSAHGCREGVSLGWPSRRRASSCRHRTEKVGLRRGRLSLESAGSGFDVCWTLALQQPLILTEGSAVTASNVRCCHLQPKEGCLFLTDWC